MKSVLTVFALFAVLASTWQPLSAQNDIVEKQVMQIGLLLALDGYELTHEIEYDNLNEGRYDNYYFSLRQGWSYKIYAVCDGDCGDIDICLFDENGNEIDCDETSDDTPIVSVTPRWSGRFRLWVKMYDCDISPCRFGMAVFGK
ncbi:MAG: hypothetical protein D6730_15995 [Bacteroidetes bacterium]|nr:MAG: hypothetical protein D6730_15995 [Bacteroidota bacterium]